MIDVYAPCVIRLSRGQRLLVGLLITREMVNKTTYENFYSGLSYGPQLRLLRDKLRKRDIQISTAHGVGNYLTKENRRKLCDLMVRRP